MNSRIILLLGIVISLLISLPFTTYAGMPDFDDDDLPIPETDSAKYVQVSFFDLRERESYVQVTNTSASSKVLHVQVFDVNNDCNENNFFDDYTGNDTHVYNMRDILTNDGDDAGLVLPDGAYGIVVIYSVVSEGGPIDTGQNLIGNFRIMDDLGYEYRTNSQAFFQDIDPEPQNSQRFFTFNFNSTAGTSFADVVGVNMVFDNGSNEFVVNPLDVGLTLDVDLFNNDEVPFSCRDVAFVCANDESPVIDSILENAGVAVAAFEYGINNALPHSKGGEVLCSGNIVDEGHARLTIESVSNSELVSAFFVGLNNGNGRGSMDSLWDPFDTDFVRDLLIGDSTVIESESLIFPVTITTPSDESLFVTLDLIDGSATSTDDYNEMSTRCSLEPDMNFEPCGAIEFPPGVTMAYYLVPTRIDDIFEPDEDLTVEFVSATGDIRNANVGTGIIMDDLMPPDITIMDSTVMASETFMFEMQLSHPSSEPITIALRTEDGQDNPTSTEATDCNDPGADYLSADGSEVTFPAGDTVLVMPFPVQTCENNVSCDSAFSEDLILDADQLSGQIGTITPGTGTINNNAVCMGP